MKATGPGDQNKPRRRLWRDRRASTALMVCMLFPVFIGIAALGVDASRLYFMKLKVFQTAQAAALTASAKLTNYYTTTTQMSASVPPAVLATTQAIATANAPTGQFGTVVPTSSIVLGNWSNTAKTFTALSGTGPFSPNAVQVTGLATTANSNPINTYFGGLLGWSSVNITQTATATFGTYKPFNVIVVNDLSGSFSSNLTNQKNADISILNCVAYGNSTAKFGVTRFNGDSGIVQALTPALNNLTTITSAINGTVNCSSNGTCSGSNIAAGLYSAIQQYEAEFRATTTTAVGTNETLWTTAAPSTSINNIVFITDGIPNAVGHTYKLQDGVTTNGTSPLCTTTCTDAQLQSGAVYQAQTVAKNLGIVVSYIYYADSGSNVAADTSYLNTLVTAAHGIVPGGTGLITPTSGSIAAYSGGVCALMGSRLVM